MSWAVFILVLRGPGDSFSEQCLLAHKTPPSRCREGGQRAKHPIAQNFRGFNRTEGPMVLVMYRERM